VLTAPVVEMTLRYAAERARTLRDLRRSEETARRALSLLAATLEATADGVLVVSLDGRITAFNRRFTEMWRVPAPVLASGDAEAVRGHIAGQLRDTDAFFSRLRDLDATAAASYDVLELRDGRLIERYAYPQRVAECVVGRVLSFRDVTHQRMAAMALHREHDLLTATIESTGEAVFAKDLEGRYLLMNTFAADLLGKDPVAVLGRRDAELFPAQQARAFRGRDLRIMETGGAVVLEDARAARRHAHMLVRVRCATAPGASSGSSGWRGT
jgi:PAS domain-containing protein